MVQGQFYLIMQKVPRFITIHFDLSPSLNQGFKRTCRPQGWTHGDLKLLDPLKKVSMFAFILFVQKFNSFPDALVLRKCAKIFSALSLEWGTPIRRAIPLVMGVKIVRLIPPLFLRIALGAGSNVPTPLWPTGGFGQV